MYTLPKVYSEPHLRNGRLSMNQADTIEPMANILLFTFLVILVLLANVISRMNDSRMSRFFFAFLFILNLPVLLIGILFVLLPESQLQTWQSAPFRLNLTDPVLYGVILQITAVLGILVTYGTTRHTLFGRTPIDPTSPVHGLAVWLAGYLAGNVGLILSQGGLAQLAETTEAATLVDIVMPAFLFTALGIFGAGYPIRRDWTAVLARLGLVIPTRTELMSGVRWIGLLILLQWIVGAIWATTNPEQAEQLTEVNDLLLTNVDTVWEWGLLALSAGIGEEILFRGAIQPVFGLPLTAVLFALGHVQYGLTPVTFLIFVLGLILGIIRQRTNTTVAIIVHAGYNFILGLLALSLPYLERLAEEAAWLPLW